MSRHSVPHRLASAVPPRHDGLRRINLSVNYIARRKNRYIYSVLTLLAILFFLKLMTYEAAPLGRGISILLFIYRMEMSEPH